MKEALQRAEQAASLLGAARWPPGAGRTLLGGEHRRLNGAGTTLDLIENVASAGRAQLADDGKRVEPREERFGGLNAAREASARRKKATEVPHSAHGDEVGEQGPRRSQGHGV